MAVEHPAAAAEQHPRITQLPGSSALVRISEGAWQWLRAVALDQEPAQEITEEQVAELERTGLLVVDPEGGEALVVEPHWGQVLRAGLLTPVGVELVCVDGTEGWTTSLRIAGRFVVVIDQVREVLTGEETLRLGARSGAITLGISTIEHLSATFESLVPQRPAFTDRTAGPVPSALADSPALAQVQMLVLAAPDEAGTAAGGGSWYALGESGEQLAVLVPAGDDAADGAARLQALAPGALTSAMRQKVIAAIGHVSARAEGKAA